MELMQSNAARMATYGIVIGIPQLTLTLLANIETATKSDYGREFRSAMHAIRKKYAYNHVHDATSLQTILTELAGADGVRALRDAPAPNAGTTHSVANSVSFLNSMMLNSDTDSEYTESAYGASSDSGSSEEKRKSRERELKKTKKATACEKKIAEYGAKARDGKISIEELTGGTFSISNGGAPSAFKSKVEQAILQSTEPITINETKEIMANKERGIWANRCEVCTWKGDLPIGEYPINQDCCPDLIKKKSCKKVEYNQEIAIRYLKPPTPQAPGEIIIKHEPNKPTAPAPPLIIRQQPPRPCTPEPLVIREAPPPPPPCIGRKVITICGKKLPAPPRKVVIERMPPIPSKPQSVVIERWLPYSEQKRRVIYRDWTLGL